MRLWAFGYNMNKDKARCWYESHLPLYGLADCEREAQRRVESEVGVWLGGAEMAAFCLREAVKDAWFSGDARGDFSVIDASFWSRTEPDFYRQLKGLIETARDAHDFDALPVREAWQLLLIKTATDLFDNEFVGLARSGAESSSRGKSVPAAWQKPAWSEDAAGAAFATAIRPSPTAKLRNARRKEGACCPVNKETGIGKVLLDWWEGLEDDRASRAILRRASSVTAVALTPPYQRLYRRLCGAGWASQTKPYHNDRLAAVVGLLPTSRRTTNAPSPRA